MKSYYSPNQIRLVGKAWEVRHQLLQLRQLVDRTGQPDLPLSQLLRRLSGLQAASAESIRPAGQLLPFQREQNAGRR